jgi:deoxyxylulose-5-phosphate synthase
MEACYRELGTTASCTIRASVEMANCGQKESEHHQNCIIGDSWFSSVKTAEAISHCGHEWIGIVEMSHSLFP